MRTDSRVVLSRGAGGQLALRLANALSLSPFSMCKTGLHSPSIAYQWLEKDGRQETVLLRATLAPLQECRVPGCRHAS